MAKAKEICFQKSSRDFDLELSACSSNLFISTRRVLVSSLVFLGKVELKLLLAVCAGIALTQGFARQPDLLSRAGKGAQEGDKPGVGLSRRSLSADDFLCDSETAILLGQVQAHVDPPGPVLLVIGSLVPFLHKMGIGVGNLVVKFECVAAEGR
jgi:hypothetical protein